MHSQIQVLASKISSLSVLFVYYLRRGALKGFRFVDFCFAGRFQLPKVIRILGALENSIPTLLCLLPEAPLDSRRPCVGLGLRLRFHPVPHAQKHQEANR